MTTIKLKNGSGAPTSGDLAQGEPALDLTNKRLYTENASGTVIEVGTNPGTDVTFADNRKAIFGAGSDLQIYHDASDSVILDNGTGNLKIQANDLVLKNADGSKEYLKGTNGGSVRVRHNNSTVLETTSTGVDVTGTVTADGLTTSGVIKAPDGSSSAPAYTNSGDADGGMFFPAANQVAFATGGGEAVRIDSSGNVGIGTTSPSEALEVTGNIHLSAGADRSIIGPDFRSLNIFANPNSSTEGIKFSTDGGTTTEVFIQDGGNVGIGTSSPSNLLDVTGSVAGDYAAAFENTNSTNGYGVLAKTAHTGTSAFAFGAYGGSNALMVVRGDGNVGIGTTSPTSDLSVGSTTTSSGDIALRTTKTAALITPSNTAAGGLDIGVGWVSGGQGPLTFSLSASEKARIDASGNFLVGTTSGFGGLINAPVTTSDEAMVTQSDSASASIHLNFRNPNGFVGSISTSASATAFNTSSDQRLKDSIVDAPSASDDIDAIQVRSFDWKADGSHQKYGMVAQELQSVAPEAVTGDADSDDMMGVDYSKLVPMMLKEIQSLRARVAQLEGDN